MDIGKYDNRTEEIRWQLEGDYDPYNPIIINQWYRGKNCENAVFYINSRGYIHLVAIKKSFLLYDDGSKEFNGYVINDYLLKPDGSLQYSKEWMRSKNKCDLDTFIEEKIAKN